ncbi:MAG: BACON domain-containing protein [Muribaculaceae bacterium]|nr:BACON domain-containing protein [Muribaculaceae bacterium]
MNHNTKMPYLPFFAMMIALVLGFVSCNSDDDNPSGPDEVEISRIEINILQQPSDMGVPYPRMVASVDDWSIIEYTSDGLEHEAMTTLHFINVKENTSMVVSGYKNTALFYRYDPFSTKKSDTVMIAAKKQGKTCVATCIMNWRNYTYRTISETILDGASTSWHAPRFGDENDDIRKMFSDMFDSMSDDISKLSKYPSKFSVAAGHVAEIWTKVAIPWAKYSLYEGRPEIQKEIREQYAADRFKEYYYTIVPTSIDQVYQKAKNVYQASKALYQNFPNADLTDEDITGMSYRFTRTANPTYQIQTQYAEEYLKYTVSASLRSVDETSAVIHAYADCTDGQPSYISEYGIDISGSDGNSRTIHVSNFENDITITGLKSGVLYTARPYVNSFGRRYECSITFMTKFIFSLHPESLTFEAKGGTKGVALNVPDDGIKSWSIKSNPKWCQIEKGATSFFVTVGESKQKRSGEIVVSAILQDGSSVEAILPVEQVSNNWNGTKWDFRGSVSVSGNADLAGNINMAQVTNFGIEIRDVEKNDFTLTGDLAGLESSSRIHCNEDNQLIWSQTETFSESGTSVRINTDITFTRTSTTTADGKLNGSASINVPGYGNINMGMNGNFSGNLVNPDNN